MENESESTPPNSTPRVQKTRLQIVFTFFTKNIVLLLLLLLLGERIHRLVFGNKEVYTLGLDERTDAVAEYLLQTTSMMIQVQIEAVDAKIEKEIEDLRIEFIERVDATDFLYWAKLRELEERIESIERSLTSEEFKLKEFNKDSEKFQSEAGNDDEGSNADEMKAYVKDFIKKLESEGADGSGRINYVEMVVDHSEPYKSGDNEWLIHVGIHLYSFYILNPNPGQPGECLPLKGNNGYVQIKLLQAIIPESITLEHVSKSMSYDRSMAPKDCKVFGWLHPNSKEMVLLTEFSYDIEKENVQTFDVLEKEYAVNMIRLEFTSNHGDPTHTCIYRIRVHGHDPDSLSFWTSINKSSGSDRVMIELK